MGRRSEVKMKQNQNRRSRKRLLSPDVKERQMGLPHLGID